MKLEYDAKVDAAYLTLVTTKVVDSEEVKPGIVVDYDSNDRIVGIEIRSLRQQLPEADISQLPLEVG